MSESFDIAVTGAPVESVSALLDHPGDDRGTSAVLFAHGAGAPLDSDFMTAIARGLAACGLPVLRFNYAYTERMGREGKRRPPDRRPTLESVHEAALGALRERFPRHRHLLAGKSMGARVGSYLAARGEPMAGLVFLGYPLHPPGKPERPRSDHFVDLGLPTLFLQGSRDSLCRPELLKRELGRYAGPVTLVSIPEGDHDFKVPRRTGRTRDEVLTQLVDAIESWERSLR